MFLRYLVFLTTSILFWYGTVSESLTIRLNSQCASSTPSPPLPPSLLTLSSLFFLSPSLLPPSSLSLPSSFSLSPSPSLLPPLSFPLSPSLSQIHFHANLFLALFCALGWGFFSALVAMTCTHDARYGR